MPEKSYVPAEYWEQLLAESFDLRKVGYPELSLAYNRCLYRAMAASVSRAIRRGSWKGTDWANVDVLDIGSGTGFWIEFWSLLGVQRLAGIDLTAAAVQNLTARYPKVTFTQRNAADPLPPGAAASVDVISVMSVLHHIPGDDAWRAALANLATMLRPGGKLVVMDPILVRTWWGPPFDATHHGRPRSLAEHEAVLRACDVQIERVLPTVSLLANPVDTGTHFEYRLLCRLWNWFGRAIAKDESTMTRWAGPAYALDRALTRLGYAPSSKLLMCRKS